MSVTPGPWTWFDYPDGRKLLSGRDRAVIHCPDAPMTCDAADQLLIAAAPELLAALTRAVAVLDADGILYGDSDDEPLDVLSAARAAIAKAEGR